MTPLFRKFLGHNWVLTVVAASLLILGYFSIESATGFRAEESPDLASKAETQLKFVALGVFFYIVGMFIDYRWVRWLAFPLYASALTLLALVPVLGDEKSGATSWLPIGNTGFSLQPSQAAIVGGVLMIAVVLSDLPKLHRIFSWTPVKLFLVGIIAGVPMMLILNEPDQGSAAVWISCVAAMLLVGSIPYRYLIVGAQMGLIVLPLVYFFVLKDYQRERIDTFLDMATGKEYDEQGAGWVPKHNMIAVGSGGWMGKGYKGSRNVGERTIKEMGFVPANVAINDFIFVVIAEEHGYRGAVVIVGVYALLLLTLLTIAFHSRDDLGRLLVTGLTAQMFFHIFMNIGMCVLLVPITGLPLPLVSYGGTFVVLMLFMLGISQSVWVHRHEVIEKKEKSRGEFRG